MTKQSSMSGGDRRGEWVAILGGAVSLASALLLGLLGIIGDDVMTAIWGAAFMMFGSVGIWVLCYIQLHQRRLYEEEQLEVAELERMRREKLAGARTIFEEDELDQMDAFSMGRRLRSIERFLVPCIALFIAAFQLAAGSSFFDKIWQFPPVAEAIATSGDHDLSKLGHTRVVLFFAMALAFGSFMLSKWAIGMSDIRRWSALRAGGHYMFGCSVVCLGIALALICELSRLPGAEIFLGKAIGILLMILAVETVLNFILDRYRPRVDAGYHRPFYDSRLFGMFSEPGGVLRNIANAIDYQFGFKVSETWFYNLLGRYVPYLALALCGVLFGLTCFLVVPPGHRAVVERWGGVQPETKLPGLHFKLCWPIDRATVIPVERIQRMVLGYAGERVGIDKARLKKYGDVMELRPPILWTSKHHKQEYKLLVADKLASKDSKVPVNLLSMEMPVQWRVRHDSDADVIRFHEQSVDAAAIIESLAYRELTRYAASADIRDLLGEGGIETASQLQKRLQVACDAAGYDGKGIGVEIVYVGIGGVHPPSDEEVAAKYEAVVSQIEKKDTTIQAALAEASQKRIDVGGSAWSALHDAIVAEDAARSAGSADLAEKTAAVRKLLRTNAGGEARMIVAEAEQTAYDRVFSQKGEADCYAYQLEAYDAAPSSYVLRLYLRMLNEAVYGVRKYVILVEDSDGFIYEFKYAKPDAFDAIKAEAGVQN